MTSILDILKKEHAGIFELIHKTVKSRDLTEKQFLVNQIIKGLSQHSGLEEVLVYPALSLLDGKYKGMAAHAREEHQTIKDDLDKLEKLAMNDPQLTTVLEAMRGKLEEHIKEEEAEIFPALSQGISRENLERMGALFENMKMVAPTRPHPYAPNTFPGNAFVVPIAALMDRISDIGKRGK